MSTGPSQIQSNFTKRYEIYLAGDGIKWKLDVQTCENEGLRNPNKKLSTGEPQNHRIANTEKNIICLTFLQNDDNKSLYFRTFTHSDQQKP